MTAVSLPPGGAASAHRHASTGSMPSTRAAPMRPLPASHGPRCASCAARSGMQRRSPHDSSPPVARHADV